MPPFAKLQMQITLPPILLPFMEWGPVVSSPSTRSKDHGLRLKSLIRIDHAMQASSRMHSQQLWFACAAEGPDHAE
ncbi:hypothetical protein J4Q44_G00280840 [Coregonus suidteri]|uniref:Uncharacterized protein n=1 Tax=Coregonus suidteri TaxID=861788 RepID=A0AAN8QKF5_9TELE